MDPWVGKVPWRRKWQPTPVFLPGQAHRQRSPMGYNPCGYPRVGYSLVPKPLPSCLKYILGEKNTKILEGKPLERLGWIKKKEEICVPKPSRVLCMLNNARDSMSNMNNIDLAGLLKKKKQPGL